MHTPLKASGRLTQLVLVMTSFQHKAPPSSLSAISGDGQVVVLLHGFQPAPVPIRPLEFDVPINTTRTGTVTIECRQPGGSASNGNGRGCQIAEVWMMVLH